MPIGHAVFSQGRDGLIERTQMGVHRHRKKMQGKSEKERETPAERIRPEYVTEKSINKGQNEGGEEQGNMGEGTRGQTKRGKARNIEER